MDETRFDSLSRVLGVSGDRRGAVRTVAGGAAALAALAAGNAGAKKKKRKEKPAPQPQAFAATSASPTGGDPPEVNWQVDGTYFHPASTTSGELGGSFQTDFELTPDKMKAELVRRLQDVVSTSLAIGGENVSPERIAVTIL